MVDRLSGAAVLSPAFAYAGALLHAGTLGRCRFPRPIHALLWLAYLARA
jgi:hypothetical protein